MATIAKSLIRALIPFPIRVALLRVKVTRRFRAEHNSYHFEKGEVTAFPYVIAEHRSPLRRPGTTYGEELQRGKETNVALVARLISGIVVQPGAEFSYHHAVGEPTASRGFVNGAEIHDGELKPGVGGGACQVSNLLYVLGLLSGCTIT